MADQKISELVENATPATVDLLASVDDPAGTPTTKKVTLANIDTLLSATTKTLTNKTLTSPVISTISNTGTLTLPTSTDVLVGRATTDTLTNKTLTSPVLNTGVSGTAVLDEDAMGSNSSTKVATQQSIKAYADAVAPASSWLAVGKTLTYATIKTFTIANFDATTLLQRGDKLKITNSGIKYLYIDSIVFDNPGSTITVIEDTTYTLTNAAITAPFYSRANLPFGFPDYFNTAMARAYLSGGQINLTTGAFIKVQLDGETFDPGSNFDVSTLVSGTADGTTSDHLIDSGTNFVTAGVVVGDRVKNTTDSTYAYVTAVANGDLTLSVDIFVDTENYEIKNAKFVAPITGYYEIGGQNRFTSVIADKRYYTNIYVNNSGVYGSVNQSASTEDIVTIATTLWKVSTGYSIDLRCYHNGGVDTVDLLAASGNTCLGIKLVAI